MKTRERVSLAEFLKLPESKPYLELCDGEVVEKAMPNRRHSQLVSELVIDIGNHLRAHPIARVDTELRHVELETDWVFLPDVSVTLKSRRPTPSANDKGPVAVVPDFAIEVLSPDDRPGRLTRRIADYMNAGLTLLWVIDPEDEQVTVWERGAEPRAVSAGDLSAAPVLPGFSVNLEALFATLHES